jgi:hypothetical protein
MMEQAALARTMTRWFPAGIHSRQRLSKAGLRGLDMKKRGLHPRVVGDQQEA